MKCNQETLPVKLNWKSASRCRCRWCIWQTPKSTNSESWARWIPWWILRWIPRSRWCGSSSWNWWGIRSEDGIKWSWWQRHLPLCGQQSLCFILHFIWRQIRRRHLCLSCFTTCSRCRHWDWIDWYFCFVFWRGGKGEGGGGKENDRGLIGGGRVRSMMGN